MRPSWTRLERRRGPEVWAGSRRRFDSGVLGPHFDALCRTWVLEHAAAETLGGTVGTVGHSTVNDPSGRSTHEIDIVAVGEPGPGRRPVLALGEATWGERMGLPHLVRLRRIRELVHSRKNVDASDAVLICAGAGGFTPELVAAAGRGEAVLVGLDRIYSGS